MKIKKMDAFDKIIILFLIDFISSISHDLYVAKYSKIHLYIFFMFLSTIPYLYVKLKYRQKTDSKEYIEGVNLPKEMPIKIIVKHFLRQIPGFRTGEKTNIIMASIYYVTFALILVIGLGFFDFHIIRIGISGLLFPYMMFAFISIINKD